MFVPVVDFSQKPLMPTTPARARKWIKTGKATPFWKLGVFCVRLNQEPSARNVQETAVGIDSGSKKEGFTIKSESHTYLNIQMDAVQHVKDKVETRRNMRKARRFRKTRRRQCRTNRMQGDRIPPSTKARWQGKLRVVWKLVKMFPVSRFVVEDVSAKTKKHARRWNVMFSPLEVGKQWFYKQLEQFAPLNLIQGYETKEMRDNLGLKKSKQKLSDSWDAHCVDSFVLANSWVGGDECDNKKILYLKPIKFIRRQLYLLQPQKGGDRKRYGGTVSLGIKKGSIVKSSKYGLCYIGGTDGKNVSLHRLSDGKRLTQSGKNFKILCHNSWQIRS